MFVMSYFRTRAEALHLAISEDALQWTPLNKNQPLLQGEIGNRSVRDPHISRDQNGLFHLFFTNSWNSAGIVHCSSRDLLLWSKQTVVPVMAHVPQTRNAWAPECFYDVENSFYRVIWSSTVGGTGAVRESGEGYDHRIWGTTTRDFIEYSKSEIFFDPGHNVIDANVAHHDGTYWMAWKDERGENKAGTDYKTIHLSTTRRIGEPWSQRSVALTATLTEGPALLRRDGEWTMFFDYFMGDRFGAIASRDGKNWTDISDQVTFPPGPRHASVLEVDEDVARGLRVLV